MAKQPIRRRPTNSRKGNQPGKRRPSTVKRRTTPQGQKRAPSGMRKKTPRPSQTKRGSSARLRAYHSPSDMFKAVQDKAPGKTATARSTTREGEIFGRKARGLTIPAKFCIASGIVLTFLVLVISFLTANRLENNLREQIKRSGVTLAESLASTARHIIKTKRKDGKSLQPTPDEVNLLENLLFFESEDKDYSIDNDILLDAVVQYIKPGGGRAVMWRAREEGLTGLEGVESEGEGITIGGKDQLLSTEIKKGTYAGVQTAPALIFDKKIYMSANTKSDLVGYATVILSQKTIDDAVSTLWVFTGILGVIFSLIGIGIIYAVAKFVSKAIYALMRDMNTVSLGDLEHTTRPRTNDEIGVMAFAFNKMTQNLNTARKAEREKTRLDS